MSVVLSEACGDATPEPLNLVHESLGFIAQKCPDKIALVSRHQSRDLYQEIFKGGNTNEGTDCLRWTYQLLQTAALRLVEALQLHGIRKGMRVATFLNNGLEYLLAQWACFDLGCPFVPLSSRNLSNGRETIHMLEIAEVDAIVAADSRVAHWLDKLITESGLCISLKVCIAERERLSNWISFSTLLSSQISYSSGRDVDVPAHDPEHIALIMFTSGTTSLPKACPHTHRSVIANICGRIERSNVDNAGVYCAVMPNNHMNGCLAPLAYLYKGGTVVYPDQTFKAASMLTALQEERCTNTIFVPTTLQAVLDYRGESEYEFDYLRQVDLGGAMVSLKHLKQCIYSLGAKKVGTSFGMTEGSPLRATPVSDPNELIRGGSVIAGKPLRETRVRICAPESSMPLPLGQYGELHQSGPQVIKCYLGKDNTDDFYEDEMGNTWFRTGDQAVMHDDCSVSIVGRYKDMIIRGGENISPLSIERVLNTIDGVDAQVVGCKEEIAGEVPIAIYKSDGRVSITVMRDAVQKSMGPSYVPDEFVTIAKLGIDDWPKTLSGKIRKTKLAALVHEYREAQRSREPARSDSTLELTVLRIWSGLLGLPPEQIDKNSPVQLFSDSIAILRFQDKLKKETGRILTLEDIASHNTIGAQVRFLADQRPLPTGTRRTIRPERIGSPSTTDMVHTHGDVAHAKKTQSLVQGVIKEFGLTWDKDVEGVMPAYDLAQVLFKRRRQTTWNFRYALITNAVEPRVLRMVLQAALSKHSLLRSFFIRDSPGTSSEVALYVTIRPTQNWFDHCIISENGTVRTVEELKRFAFNDSVRDHASLPGPLFRAMMVYVRETSSMALVFNVNHAVLDALSMRLFYEDLDQALKPSPQTLHDHAPYKVWADTYYSLRTSLQGQIAVKWHTKRLSQLGEHRKGLFPPQRAPEWFWGSSRGWTPTEANHDAGFKNPNRQHLDQGSDEIDNELRRRVQLPSLNALRGSLPGITSAVIVKAAIALLNVHYTSHTHAIFRSTEAARGSLPFLPADLLPHVEINCADLAGPCWQMVLELIEVRRDESLGSFLSRLQDDQTYLTKYANAPVLEIMKALGTNEDGTGVGDMIPDIFRRESFNWAPGLGAGDLNPYENLRPIQSMPRNDMGVGFRAGMGGPDGSECRLLFNWDGANVSKVEAERMLDVLTRILTWITEGDSRRLLGDALECLDGF